MEDNSFIDCELGVSVIGFPANNSNSIKGNQIEQRTSNTYDNGMGIYASSPTGTIRIHQHNEDAQEDLDDGYINDMRSGIMANDVYLASIFSNDIQFLTTSSTAFGVNVINSTEASVGYNDIIGHNDDYDFGIVSQMSSIVHLSCNDIGKVGIGTLRWNENGLYSLVGNLFQDDQDISIWVVQSSFPDQGDIDHTSDNRWEYGAAFGYHTYNQDPTYPPHPLYVRPVPGSPVDLDYEYNPSNFIVESINPTNAEIEKVNASGSATGLDCSEPGYAYGNMFAIGMDTLTYLGDTIRARKFSKWALYKATQTDSTLQADSLILVFVDSMKQTALGELDSIANQIAWNMTSGLADSLLDGNVKVTTNDSIESLMKRVNKFALENVVFADTVFTFTSKDSLEDIAELCPLEYGPAVHRARALLFAIDHRPRLFLNDCEELTVPQPPGQRFGNPNAEDDSEQFAIDVYPNPSDGDLFVLITGTEQNNQTYTLLIKNVLGMDVFETALHYGKNQVTLPIAAGAYLYIVTTSSNESMDQGNIVIVQD